MRALGLGVRGEPKRPIGLPDNPTADEIRAAGAARIAQSTAGVSAVDGEIGPCVKQLDRLAARLAPDTVRLELAPGFAGTDVAFKRKGRWHTERVAGDPFSPRHFVDVLEPAFARAACEWRFVLTSADAWSKQLAMYVFIRRARIAELAELAFVYPMAT